MRKSSTASLSRDGSSVNEEVMDNPTLINSDPYEAWFAVIGDITDKGELLSAEEYDEYIKTLK